MFSIKLAALQALLLRYVAVCRTAWASRKETDPPQLQAADTAFLPATLELQHTPPHPLARTTLWVLSSFLFIALLWSWFGHVDMVAIAPGKIVLSGQSKVIQALEPALVKAIHVKDGQRVTKGQLLLELDPDLLFAEQQRLSNEVTTAKEDQIRAQSILQQWGNTSTSASWHPTTRSAQLVVDTEIEEQRSKVAALSAQLTQRKAELGSLEQLIMKLEKTLPLITEKASNLKVLQESNFVSKHQWLDQEQLRIEQQAELAVQQKRLVELKAAIEVVREQRDFAMKEFKRVAAENQLKATQQIVSLQQEVSKANTRLAYAQLRAPVSGVVQQLAVHTVGGVVTQAQPLLVIVPDTKGLEVEALVSNLDVGFVTDGQEAALKLDTFPFTRYGYLTGKIQRVSAEGVQDKERGFVFPTTLTMPATTFKLDARTVALSPGMTVTVEIKTGKRRVLDYFLSPLIQHTTESLRER